MSEQHSPFIVEKKKQRKKHTLKLKHKIWCKTVMIQMYLFDYEPEGRPLRAETNRDLHIHVCQLFPAALAVAVFEQNPLMMHFL